MKDNHVRTTRNYVLVYNVVDFSTRYDLYGSGEDVGSPGSKYVCSVNQFKYGAIYVKFQVLLNQINKLAVTNMPFKKRTVDLSFMFGKPLFQIRQLP